MVSPESVQIRGLAKHPSRDGAPIGLRLRHPANLLAARRPCQPAAAAASGHHVTARVDGSPGAVVTLTPRPRRRARPGADLVRRAACVDGGRAPPTASTVSQGVDAHDRERARRCPSLQSARRRGASRTCVRRSVAAGAAHASTVMPRRVAAAARRSPAAPRRTATTVREPQAQIAAAPRDHRPIDRPWSIGGPNPPRAGPR